MSQLNPLFEKLALKIGSLEVHNAALEGDLGHAQDRIAALEAELATLRPANDPPLIDQADDVA